MKISVDAGGLCLREGNRYGNYNFTLNLIKALNLYDKGNSYNYYSFCHNPTDLIFNNLSFYRILKPRKYWMKFRVSIEELIHKKDVFLALNQSLPLFTRSKIISFSHGLSFKYFPKLYKNDYYKFNSQLYDICQRSDHIVVSSVKVRNELLSFNENLKINIIPFGVPFDMLFRSQKEHSGGIKSHSETGSSGIFLFVGMDHPIKNIDFLIEAFLKFKKETACKNYRLYLIGNHKDKGYKDVIIKNNISRSDLKRLYSVATAYLTASFYESFNLPVLEALSQGCPVVGLRSAVIPELQKYVNLVETKDEFVDRMLDLSKSRKMVAKEKIAKKFTWKNYVNELIKLYT